MEKKTIVIDADAKGAVRGLKQAQDGAKGLTTGTKAATMATGKLSTGFKMLGTAMKAAGIGLIVTAFMTLKNMMTSNIEFARKIEVVWKQLTAVFAVVVDRVTDLINGTRSLTNVFAGAGAEARREAAAMRDLTLAIQGVRDAERELVVERARANYVIAQSRLLAEDETKSKEERKNALLNAIKVEEEVADKEMELAERRRKNKEDEIAMGRSSEEDMDELAQLEANVINFQTASLLKKKRVVTEVNTFDREIAAEEKSRLKSTSGAVKEKTKSYEELHKEMRKGIKANKDVEGITKAIAEAHAFHLEKLKLIEKEEEGIEKSKTKRRKKSFKSREEEIHEEIKELNKSNEVFKIYVDKHIELEKSRLANAKETEKGYKLVFDAEKKAINKHGQEVKGAWVRIYDEQSKETVKNWEQEIKTKNEQTDKKIQELKKELDGLDGLTRKAQAKEDARVEKHNNKVDEKLKEHNKKKIIAQEEYDQAIKELREQATTELDAFLSSDMEKEIASIQEEFDKRFAMVKGNAEDEIRLEEWRAEQIENIQNTHYNNAVAGLEANAAEIKAIEQQMFDQKTSNMERSFAVASSITGSLEKLAAGDVKKQKKLALLGVAIDTAAGIASAVRAAVSAAKFSGPAAPVVTPLLIAELVALVLGGVAQASSILAKVPGGGGGGAPPLQSLQAGISVGGEGGVPGLPGEGEDIEIPPVQAFVVESDVTSSQALQNDLELQATL